MDAEQMYLDLPMSAICLLWLLVRVVIKKYSTKNGSVNEHFCSRIPEKEQLDFVLTRQLRGFHVLFVRTFAT